MPPTIIDFLAGRTKLVMREEYGGEIKELRREYGKLHDENLRLEVSLDEKHEELERSKKAHAATTAGLRFAEQELLRARDRQYLAEETVSRIREIISGRDLKIAAHQQPREETQHGMDQPMEASADVRGAEPSPDGGPVPSG